MIPKTLTVLFVSSAMLASAQTKKALSIEDFDYSTVMTAVQSIFGTQQNIGQGINAMLTKRIAQDGRFTVVERRKVNRGHQGAGFRRQQPRENRLAARASARSSGADLTLMGDIVVFGRDDRRNGGRRRRRARRGRAAGGYKQDQQSSGGPRLPHRRRRDQRSDRQRRGARRIQTHQRGRRRRDSSPAASAVAAGINMTSSNFAETIIGEATMDAVNKLALDVRNASLNGGAEARENDLDALVADVSGDYHHHQCRRRPPVSSRADVHRVSQRQSDQGPSHGEVLDVQTTPLGQLTITMVRDRIAMGTYSGAGTPVAGDVVRK